MTQPDSLSIPAFIHAFRDAVPYIQAFRGRTLVIAFGGDIIEEGGLPALCRDLLLLHSLGIHLVLVHGARPQIAAALAARGIALRYHEGERITDAAALVGVKEANGRIRVEIETLLSMGLSNTPLPGQRIRIVSGNFVTARPVGIVDGVDYEHTGRVRKIDDAGIRACLDAGAVVLLSAIGYSPTGEAFNLRASEVASTTARALTADKIIFLTDGPVPLDRQLHWQEAVAILAHDPGRFDTDGRQLLEMAITSCRGGVRRAHLIDRHVDGALLSELFTRDGVGVLINGDDYEGIRPARIEDIGGLLDLIRPLEAAGILVHRTIETLELDIEHYIVAERDGMIIACAALFCEGDAAELACLAVHSDYRGQNLGDRILEKAMAEARRRHCKRLFVLTTQAMHWFIERGFREGNLDVLPADRRQRIDLRRGSRILIQELEKTGQTED